MATVDHVGRLHATLRRRETPETVAEMVAAALPAHQLASWRLLLAKVLDGSVKRFFGWSSMSTTFHEPAGAKAQIAKARELTKLFLDSDLPHSDDPDELEAAIEGLNRLIGKSRGRSNFAVDKRDRAARREFGLELSRRRYDKLFRLAGRLERKAARLREEEAKLELVLVSKAALAPRLTLEDLGEHAPTAAFVAYYTARMKLRSEFTIDGQQRPFDEMSAALLQVCEKDPATRWWAVAHVFPRTDVLARLSDAERGRLLGTWFDILQLLAERLDAVQARSSLNLDTMVVKRGDDSSTWNILAGAWNRARDHWIALIDAMGMQPLFDTMLPGKVMRLMAADVAAWHRSAGDGVHPDTLVWRDLPKPWLVLRGEATCTRADIEAACASRGVNGAKSGWTMPRARTEVAEFRPTPELVHGVAVSNPYLATYFRSIGGFSGRPLKTQAAPD